MPPSWQIWTRWARASVAISRACRRRSSSTRYGHLRPGTYDILSPRYDEAPDLYFDWSATASAGARRTRASPFPSSSCGEIERLLKEHQLEHDVLGFIEFIKAGIEGREYAKFVFTRSLSDALSLIRRLGEEHGLAAEDCAFLDFAPCASLYHESGRVGARLRESVSEGRRALSAHPQPRAAAADQRRRRVFAFHLPPTQPNFITQKLRDRPDHARSLIRRKAWQAQSCSFRAPTPASTGSSPAASAAS